MLCILMPLSAPEVLQQVAPLHNGLVDSLKRAQLVYAHLLNDTYVRAQVMHAHMHTYRINVYHLVVEG